MLRFLHDARTSDGRLTRRQWLGVSSVAGLHWLAGLPQASRASEPKSRQGPGFGRAKSVILVFASGGQSHLDMWDPKPAAPSDIRGAFGTIPTALPGLHVCEHMPRIAQVADRFTVLRSMSHEDLDHGTAVYLALTGRYHAIRSGNPPPKPDDHPTYGAVLRRARPSNQFVHDAVHLNGPALVPTTPSPGQNGGFLGRGYEPLLVGDVREAAGIAGLEPQAALPPVRMDSRLSLKQSLDRYARQLGRNQKAVDTDRLYAQALEMLSSPATRTAFDLEAEPPQLRDRYGRHRSGQACLLARRLVEAGVPYITVFWNHSNRGQDLNAEDTDVYGWDTHNDIFPALQDHLLPRFDESFSALLEDLEQRGLLEETLVVCMGEFGRAPRVALEPRFAGASPGRKHWASAYSIVLAGAGVKRGAVVGATDRFGAEPVTDRYGPWDVAATMFHALGIDPAGHFQDSLDRPWPIAVGSPVEEIYEGGTSGS